MMKGLNVILILIVCVFGSCSSKKQLMYLNDNKYSASPVSYPSYTIQPQDILKIDVHSMSPEAALPYNKLGSSNINPNITLLQLDGYLISYNYILFIIFSLQLIRNIT